MNELLRKIPKVDELLRDPALAQSIGQYGINAVTEAIRSELEELRQGILAHQLEAMPETCILCRQIVNRVQRASLPSFRRVINGTGILLHTNLGRACLSEKAAQAVYDASRAYSNLEYNLETGKRAAATAMWRTFSAV